MATATRGRGAIAVRRSGPSPKLKRLEAAIKSRARTASTNRRIQKGQIASIAAAGALGWAESTGKLPTIDGVSPALLYGGGLYALSAFGLGGQLGRMAGDAAVGLLSVAAHRAASTRSLGYADDDYGYDG